MANVLLAGATGYLGGYIAQELQKRGYFYKVIVRDKRKLNSGRFQASDVIEAELTDPNSLAGCCQGIDIVISTVGITRQKDGLTYMDVDYQANMNVLNEARKSGVKKFIYVSVLNGQKLRELKICDAKEMFVDQLKRSGMDFCIVRPNGFFVDMSEFFHMAKKGRVFLFGDGELRSNPIHGEDLAVFCVDQIDRPDSSDRELDIGGPEILSQNDIARRAFEVLGKEPKITHIPHLARKTLLKLLRISTSSKTYGPLEFFLTVMAIEMIAPKTGQSTLHQHFQQLLGGGE